MPDELKFSKMHGAGNDFIVLDARPDHFSIETIENKAASLCNRRTGIGADGILMLGTSEKTDYSMHYLNADGSKAGMCGNGARCLALFAARLGLPPKLTFEMQGTVYRADVHEEYVSIHFPVKPEPEIISIEDKPWCVLNTGTEHVVSVDAEYASEPEDTFRQTGRRIRNRTDLFPAGTNVNFAHHINENRLKLVTYERGVEDLTLACGTGAIATAVTWEYLKKRDGVYDKSEVENADVTEHHIQVDCPGGPLEVSFDVHHHEKKHLFKNIILHGPAVLVYHGQILL